MDWATEDRLQRPLAPAPLTDDVAAGATQDARTYMLERGNALAMLDAPWAYSDRVYVVGALLTALAAAEIARDQARVALDEHRLAYTALCGERDQVQAQIDRLANFIMREIPGEPSQSQGAVDTAIRLLARATRLAALEEAARTLMAAVRAESGDAAVSYDVAVGLVLVGGALQDIDVLATPPGEGA